MRNDEKQVGIANFFCKRLYIPLAALLLVACSVTATILIINCKPAEKLTNEQLYHKAVIDSITIEEEEILPLVSITDNSDMVTWKDEKVLLMTINRHPERYIVGKELVLPGEVWTITDKELSTWYHQNKNGVTDWTLRLKQLVGVPPDGEYTHVTAMWVSPDDVLRPAYITDITNEKMLSALPESTSSEYQTWFNNNIIWSYFDSAYPWTRLGYTYDWAADGDEYGLTEFWVRPNAGVMVEYTDTIDEFINRLEKETNEVKKAS